MCSSHDLETEEMIMRNSAESDVVAEIESARAKRAFNNFINRPGARDEYLTALRIMAEQGVTPGYLRYLMQYAYQEAVNDMRENYPGGEFLETEL